MTLPKFVIFALLESTSCLD